MTYPVVPLMPQMHAIFTCMSISQADLLLLSSPTGFLLQTTNLATLRIFLPVSRTLSSYHDRLRTSLTRILLVRRRTATRCASRLSSHPTFVQSRCERPDHSLHKLKSFLDDSVALRAANRTAFDDHPRFTLCLSLSQRAPGLDQTR